MNFVKLDLQRTYTWRIAPWARARATASGPIFIVGRYQSTQREWLDHSRSQNYNGWLFDKHVRRKCEMWLKWIYEMKSDRSFTVQKQCSWVLENAWFTEEGPRCGHEILGGNCRGNCHPVEWQLLIFTACQVQCVWVATVILWSGNCLSLLLANFRPGVATSYLYCLLSANASGWELPSWSGNCLILVAECQCIYLGGNFRPGVATA